MKYEPMSHLRPVKMMARPKAAQPRSYKQLEEAANATLTPTGRKYADMANEIGRKMAQRELDAIKARHRAMLLDGLKASLARPKPR